MAVLSRQPALEGFVVRLGEDYMSGGDCEKSCAVAVFSEEES